MISSSRSRALFFAWAIAQVWMASGNSLNIDIVIILHEGAQQWSAEVDAIKAVLGQVSNAFTMGDDKTRVALIGFRNNNWAIFSSLTGDANAFSNAAQQLESLGKGAPNADLNTALNLAREQIFTGSFTRPRGILVVSLPEQTNFLKNPEQETEHLLKASIVTFVVFYADSNRAQHAAEFAKVTGNAEKVVDTGSVKFATSFTVSLLQQFQTNLTKYLCTYDGDNCFFSDSGRKTCQAVRYTKLVPKDGGDCAILGFTAPQSTTVCGANACNNTCDNLWPWMQPDCKTKCGVTIDRDGDYRWKQLEFCSKSDVCPNCPTTTKKPESSSGSTTTKPGSTASLTTTKPGSTTAKRGSSAGLIIGILVPAILIVLIPLAVAAYWYMKRRDGSGTAKSGVKGAGTKKAASDAGGKKKNAAGKTPKKKSAATKGKKAAIEPLEEVKVTSMTTVPMAKGKGKAATEQVKVASMTTVPVPKKAGAKVPSITTIPGETKVPSITTVPAGKGQAKVPSITTLPIGKGKAPPEPGIQKVKSMTTMPQGQTQVPPPESNVKVASMTTVPVKGKMAKKK